MPDDPDESFIIHTVLENRPSNSVPATRPGTSTPVLYAPGDDAARIPGDAVVTVDAMVEGVHWDEKLTAADVGWKLVAVNASDINAMGALPQWAVLTLSVPEPADRQWIESFSKGLGEALEEWSIQLVGGDTTRSPSHRMVSLTLTGVTDHPVGRSGARAGDDIWVSGPLGGAAAGFFLPQADRSALQRPRPPIGLGQALGGARLVSAMMDLSDGLMQDLPKLCKASNLGALVHPNQVPIHHALDNIANPFAHAVGFGEDYELLFAAPAHHRASILATAATFGVNPTRVGMMRADKETTARLSEGRWPEPLFSHFSKATG